MIKYKLVLPSEEELRAELVREQQLLAEEILLPLFVNPGKNVDFALDRSQAIRYKNFVTIIL